MMKKQNLLAFLCSIFLIIGGCGVPKDEYEKKVGELAAEKEQNEKLVGEIEEKDSRIAELEKMNAKLAQKGEELQENFASEKKRNLELQEEKEKKAGELAGLIETLSRLKGETANLEAELYPPSDLDQLLPEGTAAVEKSQIVPVQKTLVLIHSCTDTFDNGRYRTIIRRL